MIQKAVPPLSSYSLTQAISKKNAAWAKDEPCPSSLCSVNNLLQPLRQEGKVPVAGIQIFPAHTWGGPAEVLAVFHTSIHLAARYSCLDTDSQSGEEENCMQHGSGTRFCLLAFQVHSDSHVRGRAKNNDRKHCYSLKTIHTLHGGTTAPLTYHQHRLPYYNQECG